MPFRAAHGHRIGFTFSRIPDAIIIAIREIPDAVFIRVIKGFGVTIFKGIVTSGEYDRISHGIRRCPYSGKEGFVPGVAQLFETIGASRSSCDTPFYPPLARVGIGHIQGPVAPAAPPLTKDHGLVVVFARIPLAVEIDIIKSRRYDEIGRAVHRVDVGICVAKLFEPYEEVCGHKGEDLISFSITF